MELVNAECISKIYGMGGGSNPVHALNNVSFSIEEASFVSFVGPSGSGKTTLLNIIGCLDRPTEGNITVCGQNPSAMNRSQSAKFRGENIGFIFQDFNLMPVLSVYENVEYPLILVQNLPADIRKKRVEKVLSAVGMLEHAAKRPAQLSGGQKQRTAVARALVTEPALILADEPTANLDHDTSMKIINLMKSMRDEFGTSFIFSTHDPKIVEIAEKVYVMEDGVLSC
ncbi:MAG: ABC transporter ATP-binding protein [Deferribacterales bacterium]